MQDILLNLAHLHLLDYCKEQKIDTSNSFVKKMGRGFTYGLADYPSGKVFAQVTFTKNTTPAYWWGDAARQRGK